MKKTMKKFVILVLVLSLVFITACSKDKSEETSGRRKSSKDDKTEKEDKDEGLYIVLAKDVKLDLKDDIGNIIKQVYDNNGCVIHAATNKVLEVDEKGNIIQSDKTAIEAKEGKDFFLFVSATKKGSGTQDVSIPGCMMYSFLFYDVIKLSKCSLFDGWSGLFKTLDSYMNDENCIDLGNRRIGVFKEGKLVNVSDLIKEYGSQADMIIDNYNGSLLEYYINAKGMEKDQAMKTMYGLIGYLSNVSEFDRILSSNTEGINISETKRAAYCMVLAMNDWGADMDSDHLADYGSVEWTEVLNGFDIFIPCSHLDMERVNKAPKASATVR
ncbi:MAG: hypothetical protein IK007_03130 [Lachnospiraceae bacterium]|nr:hypothetical protein [Lachnospiraceae bacterium]